MCGLRAIIYLFISYFLYRILFFGWNRVRSARARFGSAAAAKTKKKPRNCFFFYVRRVRDDWPDSIDRQDEQKRLFAFFLRKKVQLERVFLVVFFIGLVLDFDSWTRVLLGPLGFIDVRNNRVGRILKKTNFLLYNWVWRVVLMFYLVLWLLVG